MTATNADAGAPRPPTAWDGAEAEAFLALVARERQAIGRERFAGRDPAVRGPSGTRAAATLARVLAADREGATVDLGGERVNPGEDRAEEALQRALGALGQWGFDVVRRELAVAAVLARAPERQQRIELVRALAGLLRALVLTEPGERLRGEEITARGVLARLDALPLAERDHYAAEVARLLGHWRAAADGGEDWRAWALLRGRLAQRQGGIADEAALAWALRAWDRRDPDQPEPDADLIALLAAARATFLPLAAGVEAPEAVAARERAVEPPRALDVLAAVAAALARPDRDGAGEPFAGTRRFALVPYHATADAAVGEGVA